MLVVISWFDAFLGHLVTQGTQIKQTSEPWLHWI